MRAHRTVSSLVAALIVAATLPPAIASQTVTAAGVDVHAFGLSPADVGFGGADAFGLPPAFADGTYGSAYAGPGRYASCGGSTSSFLFMFGSAPGRFNYGWYSSPRDFRFSRNWLTPWQPAYGFWAHHYGFGYGSRVGSYGWNPWSPWSSVRTGCGSSGFGYGFSYWGAGGAYFPIGPTWGTPYGPEWGWDYYPGSWRSFTPAGPPRYVERGSSRAKPSVAPRAYPDRSVYLDGERPGTRVIESRPATGGADLRKVDPRRRAVALEDLAETTAVESGAVGRAVEDLPTRETITDAINRARARAAERRTEVVKTPLHPVDPRREGPAGARGAASNTPRSAQPRPGPGAETRSTRTEPRATPTRTRQPNATQPRSRPAPRVIQRPTRSTRPSPEARSGAPAPSRTGNKGRTPQ